MRPEGILRKTPIYYLVGDREYILPETSDEPAFYLQGHKVNAEYVTVAVTPYENLVCMYDYIPNNTLWVRNTALENDHWMVDFDSYNTLFEQVPAEIAFDTALAMKSFNPLIIDMLMREVKDDFFKMQELFPSLKH